MSEEKKRQKVSVGQVLAYLVLIAVMGSSIIIVFGAQTSGTNCNSTVNFTNCSGSGAYGCIFIRNATGSTKAIFDGGGFVDIKGSFTPSADISPGSGEFLIKDTAGTYLAKIYGTNGNMEILGTLTADTNNYTSPPAGSFVVKNKAGIPVAYIDSSGNMRTRGEVCYNARIT